MRCLNAVDSIIICVEQQQTTILRMYKFMFRHFVFVPLAATTCIKYDNYAIDRTRWRGGHTEIMCFVYAFFSV